MKNAGAQIVGMDGYHFFLISGYLDILDTDFFLDTWINGYLDIVDKWIHGYLDTWISVFFGYMGTWILWISIFFIIHILDILSKYPDIFGYFFKVPNVKKGNQIQLLRLFSMFFLSIDKIRFKSKDRLLLVSKDLSMKVSLKS
jgi:hypothetical protein